MTRKIFSFLMFQKLSSLFRRKKGGRAIAPAKPESKSRRARPTQPEPRILLLDIDELSRERLREHGFNVASGTLGTPVAVPNNERYQEHRLLGNWRFVESMHEVDIVVADLAETPSIPFDPISNSRRSSKGYAHQYFLSVYPETKFDPRAYGAHALQSGFNPFVTPNRILILFAASDDEVEYSLATVSIQATEISKQIRLSSRILWGNDVGIENKSGNQISVSTEAGVLRSLMASRLKEFSYQIIFKKPMILIDGRSEPDPLFKSLMVNRDNEIVAFTRATASSAVIVLPRIKDKTDILLRMLAEVLPSVYPKIFPYSTRFAWLEKPEYFSPEERALHAQLKHENEAHEKTVNAIQTKMQATRDERRFLYDMVTKSDADLVKAVETYFRWLEFANIRNMDELFPDQKEEDLQFDLPDGWLAVVEIKGIGGTSTDADCAQVSKIRSRRIDERRRVDVVAIYVVNHQRFLEPSLRRNPPFSEDQIKDAGRDKRGLITTWDLFRAYFEIEAGMLKKEDVRASLLVNGLVRWQPSLPSLGCPQEIHDNGRVAILALNNIVIRVGQDILIHDGVAPVIAKITSIQVQGQNIQQAQNGEVGIKVNGARMKLNSRLYLKG